MELTFNKIGDRYESKFTSTGSTIIQVDRPKYGFFSVWANIEGMEPIPITEIQIPHTNNVIFNLEVPAGLEITLVSGSEVTSANTLE